jgi:hypothetical protein
MLWLIGRELKARKARRQLLADPKEVRPNAAYPGQQG